MNSFILLHKDLKKRQAYIAEFSQSHKISPFDQTTVAEEGSIGIEIVRKIQQTVFLKPYKGTYKSIVLENAQNLTIEAQNALLKLLEEPPIYTFLFLSATTDQNFLPTIFSRCQVIRLSEEGRILTADDIKQLQEQLSIVLSDDMREKLFLAETLASQKEALPLWFENILHALREEMLKKDEKTYYAQILLQLQEAHRLLTTTNVNSRALLEHCFLNV